MLDFGLQERSGAARPFQADIRQGVIAGWTGRDLKALEDHIRELEHLGVPRPASVPIFYRVAAARFTTAGQIEASGEESSGEVEFALLRQGGELYLGVGSDHTDRQVETYGITVSKQMCDKPIAPSLWRYADVQGHWSALVLRSWIVQADGARVLYQEGSVAAMRPPEELCRLYADGGLPEGALMFCGTHPAIGGIRPAARFEFELSDPVLGRSITHGYDILTLPIAG